MVVWWSTPVECLSALAHQERDGGLSPEAVDTSRLLLTELRQTWNEIQPSEEVRDHAGRFLLRHPLRAADSLQLAAAMTWVDGRPRGQLFCTLDGRLAGAARREGFALALRLEGAS